MLIKLGSLFDGIGGWPLAAVKQGITPVWASEIEKFPIEITKKHFPAMKHLGDICDIKGNEIEPVDIICMGSPCQNLSIAGNRKGLGGEQSSLFIEGIRIIREMRDATNGKYPRWVVWENVPGAFSSNKGLDFRTVLEEITESKISMPESGRWAHAGMVRGNDCEVAWRVLDAQYWGVPQRRKRIFLVADFRGSCAGEILFKPKGVQRYPTESGGTRQGASRTATESTRATSVCLNDQGGQSINVSHDIAPTLRSESHGNNPCILCYDMTHADEVMRPVKGGIVPTLNARMGTGGNQVPVIQEPVYCIAGNTINRKIENGGNGKGINEEVSFTLNTIDRHAAYNCAGHAEYKAGIGTLRASGGDCGGGSENLIFSMQRSSEYKANNVSHTLASRDYKSATDLICTHKVRRLTPTECERLQGLPDNWTEGGSDSARYKALGNGMAQPCADFVIRGISALDSTKTVK